MLEISPLAMDTNVSDFLGDVFSYDLLEHHGKYRNIYIVNVGFNRTINYHFLDLLMFFLFYHREIHYLDLFGNL